MNPEEAQLERQTWAARFGWIAGGVVGVLVGFVLTWQVEMRVLAGRGRAGIQTAADLSGLVVPVCFIVGALLGHAYGAKGGALRFRLLGSAAGLGLAVLAWALLVATR